MMLQIAPYNSLSSVIPSKIFEYAASNYPIIFAAEGFTTKFISKIEGTFEFTVGLKKFFSNY